MPGTPLVGAPSAGRGLVVVRWTAPVDDGGSPILRYEIQARRADGTPAGAPRPAAATASVATVSGLTNGVAYRFTVRAVNAEGTGAWSAASAAVTPVAPPAAPAALTATAGPAGGKLTATVKWTPPATANGRPVTGYRLTFQRLTSGGAATGPATVVAVAAATRSSTITAPPRSRGGVRYRITVQAVNAAGVGTSRTVFTLVR